MRILPKFLALLIAGLMVMLAGKQVFAATTNVSITSTGFVPESITVTVGDTVVWTNNDTTEHTATDDELTWDTDEIVAGDTGSQIFNTAGTYTYSDTIDPELTGTIIVQAASSGSSSTTTTTTTTTSTSSSISATPRPQPVSGASGPTILIMALGGLLILGGIYSLRLL